MYQGKHVKRKKYSKRRANKRKATVLLSSLALILALFVGVTTAFLIAKDGSVVNTFKSSQVSCEVNESFNGTTKSNVSVSNTGDTEAYIRAAIVVTWKDAENGDVYGAMPVLGTDYTMDMDLSNWIEGSDGYYYYKKAVQPDGETDVLIVKCKAVQDNVPAGYGLNVEILSSAIQSVPVSVVNEKWPAVHVDVPHGELTKGN